jgi:hypothetical protein
LWSKDRKEQRTTFFLTRESLNKSTNHAAAR